MRVVSLVPSLTETLFDLGLGVNEVVGRTPWCIHPAAAHDVPVVGGTKTPNLKKILDARPDVVVLDREENPKAVHDALVEQGVTVVVSTVEHPAEVPALLRELGEAVGRADEGERLAEATEGALAGQPSTENPGPRVTPMIWHEPLMAVGPRRYAGALLEAMGWTVPDLDPEGNGYPVVTPALLVEHRIEGLLLSSEPHAFALEEGEAIADAVEALALRGRGAGSSTARRSPGLDRARIARSEGGNCGLDGSIRLACALVFISWVLLFQDGFQFSEFLRALHLEKRQVFLGRFELDGHDEDLLAFLALVALAGHETHVGIDLNAVAI